MAFRFVVLLAALFAVACARDDATPRVLVEPVASGDWRATWDAGTPVESLRFVRAAGFLREREWRVVTPDYAFRRDGDAQVLALNAGGTAADRIVIEFPRNTDPIERDYELFNTFTDGSVALFLGHFAATLNAAAMIDRVTVVPPAGQRVVGGDYAYVGTIDPVEHERLTAIVDPGLPPWLASSLTHYTPQLFDFYAARTGRALAEKPVVLLSFEPDAPGRSVTGGVVGNQVQLRVVGDGWRADDPWAVRAALRLLAHEAAHLWNGNDALDAPAWMHEGGAEAFADEALHALGIFDDADLRAAYATALAACADGVRRAYTCGEAAAWGTDLAVRAAQPGVDLFSFWGALVARAANEGGYYGPDDYFEGVAAFGVPVAAVTALRRFTMEPGDDTLPALLEMTDEICDRAVVAGLDPRCLRAGPED